MKKRFKWSTKNNVKKRGLALFIITILLIVFTFYLSKELKCELLFTIMANVFLIYALKVLLNDLVDIEKFEENFSDYSFTYLVVLALGILLYIIQKFDSRFFFQISVSLLILGAMYFIACTKILSKLNVGEKKIWLITITKSVFGALGAWGVMEVLLFSTGNKVSKNDFEKSFYLSMRIISSGAAFYYPIIDMYLYTHQKINEYKQSVLKKNRKRK